MLRCGIYISTRIWWASGPKRKLTLKGATNPRRFLGTRYVGDMSFHFHVLQLLVIRFTLLNLCCTRKSTMKGMQNSDWKSYLPLFSYGYQNRMFVDFLNEYIGPPNRVDLLSAKQLLLFKSIFQSFYKHVSLRCLLSDSHQTTHQWNIR